MSKRTTILAMLLMIVASGYAQLDVTYKEPDPAIKQLAEAPPPPVVLIDEEGDYMFLLHRTLFSSIKELSDEEFRLAGLRINPRTNGPSRMRYYRNITLRKLGEKEGQQVNGLPEDPRIANVGWSPDFRMLAFTNDTDEGIELWIVDKTTAEARKLTDAVLNGVFRGRPYSWTGDSQGFIATVISSERPALAGADQVPQGPVVSENLGTTAPARTYQDLLKSPRDEQNFDHFATSELVRIDLEGNTSGFMGSAVYSDISISPGGDHVMVSTLEKPYSYLVPYYRFPYTVNIVDMQGNLVKKLFEIKLDEARPVGRMSTTPQPRSIGWRADKPASIYFVQALDNGDQAMDVEHRDALYEWEAPFNSTPEELVRVRDRYAGVRWGNEGLAVVQDMWRTTRKSQVYFFDPGAKDQKPEPSISYDTEDRYALPGSFVMTSNESGYSVLLTSRNGRSLYLVGEGYSPEGNRPFIDEYDVRKKETRRIWRAEGETHYENIVDVLDIQQGKLITRRESRNENPNYFVRNVKNGGMEQITFFPNPYESMTDVKVSNLRYKRDDDVDLNAVLYLPPGYDQARDGRLPVLLWAYPREFKNANAAGQVKDSPHRFTRISYGSPIFWAMRGYAVLDRTDFPIIGEGEEEPNDTFVEQLVANGKAAIDELDRMGIADPSRVGVGGHSYGAFMTANLLAHSDLFAAGIARSGAYNRTLTPFGFQNEERTFWEAPEVYFRMSPFMHAHKIDEPLLLIHGTHDNNSGTFPMQSDRLFNAVKGHGGTVRLVRLPYESHGYAARESIMHMLWEMDNWLETYVKNREKMPAGKIDIERK